MNEHDATKPLTLADVVPAGSGTPEEAIAGRGFTLYESSLLGGAMREPAEIERPHRPRHTPQAAPVPMLRVEDENGEGGEVRVLRVPADALGPCRLGEAALSVETPARRNAPGGYAALDGSAPFAQGSVPFADAEGQLTHDATALRWDAAGRCLGVGGSLGLTGTLAFAPQSIDLKEDGAELALGDGVFFRLTSDEKRAITSIAAGVDGRVVILRNAGEHELTFAKPARALAPGACVTLVHDGEWRVLHG